MLDTLFISAVILGIVEGLTEFLPVSSTGHLILAAELIGFTGPGSKVFEVVIQLGAILAVCWVYRERLFNALTGLLTDPAAQRFVANIVIAFLPAAVAGVLLHRFIKEVLFSPWVVAVSLIVGGFLILLIERIRPLPRVRIIEGMPLRTALAAGEQDRLWDVVHELYAMQGHENSGWVSDRLLESLAYPGFDVDRMLAETSSPAVDRELKSAADEAQRLDVNSTPTLFAGPTGGTLGRLAPATHEDPASIRAELDRLLAG